MSDCVKSAEITLIMPQCQYFVVRKKRLCRMTVRPGREYCGEHELQPPSADLQADLRVPCPYDPKHTCYASKLQKHLLICNARQDETLPYIVHNINAPKETTVSPRKPLGEISKHDLIRLIDKVNFLYEQHVQDNVTCAPLQPIHTAVAEEFAECDRAESSRRHLRQASSLLHIAEEHKLVGPSTCYVELGAGKGHLSYFAYRAWCEEPSTDSGVLAVDRASLRHKRDNRLRDATRLRLRTDLAHLALGKVPAVEATDAVVGFAKHLCGVAMDYALRCITSESVLAKCRGAVLATCCHHRCELAGYVANAHLQKLGINNEELNIMLGVVSWATCGDGRSRERRKQSKHADNFHVSNTSTDPKIDAGKTTELNLKDQIVKKNLSESSSNDQNGEEYGSRDQINEKCGSEEQIDNNDNCVDTENQGSSGRLTLSQEYREKVGRRAKAILDWGRVLYLREKGFEAHLCYYVPTAVSLENYCIVARKGC